MNSAEIKEISLAYNELFKSTKEFNEFKESLDNRLENDSFSKEQVQQIVTKYQIMLDALEKFERELDKLEQYMSPGIFKNLKDALVSEKTALGKIVGDATGFLDNNNSKYLDSLMNSIKEEKDISATFAMEIASFSNDLGFNLLMQAMDEKISLQDLQLMSIAFESDSDLHERITHVMGIVEKRQEEREKRQEDTATLTDEDKDMEEPVVDESLVEHSETVANGNSNVTEERVSEPRKLTLEEKIAVVNYQQGMNLNSIVQEITLESKLEEITAEISQLQGKEKLTVKDKFRLRQLMEQQLAFEAYGKSLEEQKVSMKENRRNKKLSATTDKIGDKAETLAESVERSQDYTSKTMRFLSSRYQSKLNEQLQGLREKQGMLTDMQKASAVARFDKNSKKLMRKARRKGTIDQLKAYKDSLVQELQNLGQDVVRFFSTKEEDMEVLTDAVVIMPDNIISLEERRRALTQGSMVA